MYENFIIKLLFILILNRNDPSNELTDPQAALKILENLFSLL